MRLRTTVVKGAEVPELTPWPVIIRDQVMTFSTMSHLCLAHAVAILPYLQSRWCCLCRARRKRSNWHLNRPKAIQPCTRILRRVARRAFEADHGPGVIHPVSCQRVLGILLSQEAGTSRASPRFRGRVRARTVFLEAHGRQRRSYPHGS